MVFRKGLFSQRNGYVEPRSVFIREVVPQEVLNAIENCYTELWEEYDKYRFAYAGLHEMHKVNMEHELWVGFLCYSVSGFKDYNGNYKATFLGVLKNEQKKWYDVLDLLEYTIKYMQGWADKNNASLCRKVLLNFIKRLNHCFERLDFAYRIIDNEIVEISDDNEIDAIEQSSEASSANVKEHLQKSMQHLSRRPDADASNSIKESISALEAVCRDLTGEATLGKSLKKLEAKGISIHPSLKDGLDKLYIYTNQPDTGIRHALMDADGNNVPSKDEAHLMLVLCSAFINYLRAKSASR